MNVSMWLFVIAMVVGGLFLTGLTWLEAGGRQAGDEGMRQKGESSLSRHSINWLGGIALLAAGVICWLVK